MQVGTSLDLRRQSEETKGNSACHHAKTLLYFEIKIDNSELPTYNNQLLQCAVLAIVATLIALL